MTLTTPSPPRPPSAAADRGARGAAPDCVEHAIASGDKADQRRKIAELMDVVGRADR